MALLAVSTVSAQADEYDISIDSSIDTPDRTVTFDGQSYGVTAVKQADPGDSISVTADAPEENFVEVYIYNSDRQIVDSKEIEAGSSRPATVSFDLSGYSSGSYVVALSYDGEIRAVHPLIVRAYDVSITAPNEAPANEQITLSSNISQIRPGTKSGVEFVILSDADTLRINASEIDGIYEATTDFSSLSPDDYSVYATVRGSEEIAGNDVRLGLSQPQSLSITEESTDDTSDSNPGGGGGGGSTGDTVSTDTPTATPDNQETATSTVITSTPVPETSTATQQTTDSQIEESTTAPSTATESNAITPRSTESASNPTTDRSGPGFTLIASIVALISAGMVFLIRRQQD
jgi:hypothetical protein